MGKDKLIMKKPKKPMNAMEAYRRKTKEKEKAKNKTHKREHREIREKGEIEKHQAIKEFKNFDKDLEDDEELEDGGDFMDPNAIQQILQEKRRMQELRHDRVNINSNIQDLMQTFSKKPTSTLPLVQKQSTAPSQTNTAKQESGLSSFMNDNVMRNFNLQKDPNQSKPVFLPSTIQQQQQQASGAQKTMVGDKRLQKREGAGGNIDPFMMTTMQGDYNPTQKKKNEEAEEEANPMQGSYVSRAPGVFQSIEKAAQKPFVSAEPTVIVKEAALTMAPLRSQMEKEKSSLIPVHLLRKKAAAKPTTEVAKPNQLPSNLGIQNVTNVPAPKMGLIMPQSFQQHVAQNATLSAFLSEINELDDGN